MSLNVFGKCKTAESFLWGLCLGVGLGLGDKIYSLYSVKESLPIKHENSKCVCVRVCAWLHGPVTLPSSIFADSRPREGPGWMTPLQPGQPQRLHCAPQPSVIIHHILTWQPTAQPPNSAKDGGLGYHDESTTGLPASDLCWTRAESTFKFWNGSPLHLQTKDLWGQSQEVFEGLFHQWHCGSVQGTVTQRKYHSEKPPSPCTTWTSNSCGVSVTINKPVDSLGNIAEALPN